MKNPFTKTLPLIVMTFTLLVGCKDYIDSRKVPKACIDGPEEVMFGSTHTYSWCGDKAEEIKWQAHFGNSAEGESITITFSNKAEYEVHVTAANKNSKEATLMKKIVVK